MRIGIFSDSINIPPKEGINVHTYNVALALANLPQTKVVLIVCDRGWLDLDILKDQPFDTLVLSSADFYDYTKIVKIIEDHSLDVLQTYMVYFAAVVLGMASYETKKPMCIEFHDLEKAIAPIYLSDKFEIAFHEDLQYRAACLASMVRIMSAYDYEAVVQTWPELSNIVTWMPVSIQDPKVILEKRAKKDNHVLFIGNTSYPPNAAAADYIQKSLAPKLPDVVFSLVGRGTERFTGVNIKPHGAVDTLEGVLQTHSVGLAPIFEGSGMKIKLLDYLSAGIPILATPLGAHGYPESEAIIVEENLDKWPSILESLLCNHDELQVRSKAARELFLDHFNLESNIHKVVEMYRLLDYAAIKSPSDFSLIEVDQSKIYWLREVR
ncbi:glycosyltransferase family 4 protein, partial [Candidatus Saccharibacteria bacterium]|nr:glycosyltransferase family 4 protein [Candidatus Saccharibacteria bacterium]